MFKTISVFLLLLSHLCLAKTNKIIEIEGYRTDISLENHLALVKTDSPRVWRNPENTIELQFVERLQSFDDLQKEVTDTLNSDATSIITDNPVKAVAGIEILTTQAVKEGINTIRMLIMGGNEVAAFMVILSMPEILLNETKPVLDDMLSSLNYSSTSLSLFHDMPFEISNVAGFSIKQKYQNSLVLKSTPYNTQFDALLIISAVPEYERPSMHNIEEKTLQILQNSGTLDDIEIIDTAQSDNKQRPEFLIKAKARLLSNNIQVDILHSGSIIDSNYLIAQLIVEKTSVSFLKMEDVLADAVHKVRFKE